MQKTNADLIGTRGFQKVQESKKQLSNGIVYVIISDSCMLQAS